MTSVEAMITHMTARITNIDSKTTGKGQGLAEATRKGDRVELDFILAQ